MCRLNGFGTVVGIVDGTQRIPDRRTGEFRTCQHVRTAVLHSLELTDRPTELHTVACVRSRSVDRPLREPHCLGTGEGRGDRQGLRSTDTDDRHRRTPLARKDPDATHDVDGLGGSDLGRRKDEDTVGHGIDHHDRSTGLAREHRTTVALQRESARTACGDRS